MLGVVSDDGLLRDRRGGEPHGQTIVVMVVGGVRELLAPHEPRRLTMAQLLGHSGQRHADPAKPLGLRRVGGS